MTDFEKYASPDRRISSMTLNRYGQFVDSYINPAIIEERKMNVATMDVFSRLMMDRIIFLGLEINPDVANIIQAQLLYLASVDDKADISLYINTPGGAVSAGLSIYDTMRLVRPDIATICTGMAASMGQFSFVPALMEKGLVFPIREYLCINRLVEYADKLRISL